MSERSVFEEVTEAIHTFEAAPNDEHAQDIALKSYQAFCTAFLLRFEATPNDAFISLLAESRDALLHTAAPTDITKQYADTMERRMQLLVLVRDGRHDDIMQLLMDSLYD